MVGTGTASRPFVGRRAELHQFNGLLAACSETGGGTGCGVVIHIRGEAGIGKSRLVEEFQRMAGAQGFCRVTGAVLDFGIGCGQDAIKSVVKALVAELADTPEAYLPKDCLAPSIASIWRR